MAGSWRICSANCRFRWCNWNGWGRAGLSHRPRGGPLGSAHLPLRFWETAFPEARAQRSPSGQRFYTEEAVDLLRRIKYLVHEEGLTLAGARRRLQGEPYEGAHRVLEANQETPGHSDEPARDAGATRLLEELRRELEAIVQQLREGPGRYSQGGSHG